MRSWLFEPKDGSRPIREPFIIHYVGERRAVNKNDLRVINHTADFDAVPAVAAVFVGAV